MKHPGKIIAILSLLVFSATAAVSAQGNPKKGKYLYKKTCKSCHVAGAEGKPLTPLSKTQAQWDRFFQKGEHPKKEAWKGLSEGDINDVRQFLYDHAADSSQPETCG